MKQIAEADVVIVGGGIAGLWLLNRLRQTGYSAVLLEAKTLGGGQTHLSQGIIHGGMKYALQGAVTGAAATIADMPKIWNDCLHGKGVMDLSHVPVLSEHQYLWSTASLTSKIAGFFSGLLLKGNVESLTKETFPQVFQHADFKGQVYSLDEMVIDVNALVRELVKPNQDVIYKIDPLTEEHLHLDDKGQLSSIEICVAPLDPIRIQAQRFVFTAGAGNEILTKKLNCPDIKMQRRPLQMVVVKTDYTHSLYAHCLGLGATPRITVTTHRAHDGKSIWYLGGQLAEEGIKRTPEEQIAFARSELSELFPWLDFSNAQFATFFVDRAEAMQPDGKRPDSCYVKETENMILAWPTKLAFAPKLADEVIEKLKKAKIQPSLADVRAMRAWPIPAFAKPVWDELLP
jgi:glycerol-3-phosphate dehydrogenase